MVVGRGRLDAALYAPPPRPRPGQMGRPRVRGAKLASPASRAAEKRAPWKKLEVRVYGKTVTIRVLVIDALWYIVAGSRPMRLVVVRDFPGHERDDVFVSTDPSMSAADVIETFALRWSLEVFFREAKQLLGFADSSARKETAVRRVAPFVGLLYTALVVWFLEGASESTLATPPVRPWYPHKRGLCFADILRAARRAMIGVDLLDLERNINNLHKLPTPSHSPRRTQHRKAA